MSTFARMTRISIIDELGKDYVRAARARGLSLAPVVGRHVLRNAAIPVITIAALEIGNLLAGAVIVETVFAWPGIGQLAIQSIQSRDFLVVQVIVLLISFVYVADQRAGGLRLRDRRSAHPPGALRRRRCRIASRAVRRRLRRVPVADPDRRGACCARSCCWRCWRPGSRPPIPTGRTCSPG